MTIMDGIQVADGVADELKSAIKRLQGRRPNLSVLLVGEHPASEAYVAKKRARSASIGMHSEVIRLAASVKEEDVLAQVTRLNADDTIDGILVQLPLPPHISAKRVMRQIDPTKDVDGFHPVNLGKLLAGETDGFIPCTPLGIKELLTAYEVPLSGQEVVIVGRSNIVGKPLAALLVQKQPDCNATVTMVHSATHDIKSHCLRADVLIVAIGKAHFVCGDMVKPGAVVVDVGINRVEDSSTKRGYRIVGDVDFAKAQEKAAFITPVPGGVGPMTVAMLLKNTWRSFLQRQATVLTNTPS